MLRIVLLFLRFLLRVPHRICHDSVPKYSDSDFMRQPPLIIPPHTYKYIERTTFNLNLWQIYS